MKLLEILQKVLRGFPEGMLYAVQDYDGEVKFAKHSQPTLRESGVWWRYDAYGTCPPNLRLELAEDWDSAIVTKDMWESDRVKQIIVNVNGLSVEEKQRINEALAKITGATKLPAVYPRAGWLFAPASPGSNTVSWVSPSLPETPTHYRHHVLEMTGMTEKRKVRTDFDKKYEYSVDVSNCTEDEKKKVQQAFFDVGFVWESCGKEYRHLDAVQYTNTTGVGFLSEFCLHGSSTEDCNMNPDEFFSYVYEPVQQGHVHADLMVMYAEDAKTTNKPWELWQSKDKYMDNVWFNLDGDPIWHDFLSFRRKPKTKLINGVEIPDIGIDLSLTKERTDFYTPCVHNDGLFIGLSHHKCNDRSYLSTLGVTYPYTEEGKQAAILHAKAWLCNG